MAKNWHETIQEARARGGFVFFDVTRAGQWVDCACGEQDSRIPRTDGVPDDYALFHLGNDFYRAVKRHDFDEAERTLAAIERRSAEILASLDSGTKEEE